MELFDIDKELRALSADRPGPSEELRQQTRRMVSEAVRMKKKRAPRRRLIYYPAAVAVLAIIMVVSVFSAAPAQAAGYYTIDINPSVSIAVDGGDNVISAEARNDDAKDLLKGLKLRGMRFEDALKIIIQTAAQKKYLKDNGHLLVAHFGSDEGMTQQRLDEIVSGQLPESGVTALAINGGIGDYEKYEKASKKAGIELLMDGARDAGIEDKDVDKVIGRMLEKQPGSAKDDKHNAEDQGNSVQATDKAKEDKPATTDEKNNENNGKDKAADDKDEKDKPAGEKEAGDKDGKDNEVKDKNEKGDKKDKEEKEDKEK